MKLGAVILLLASLPALAQNIPDNAQGFDQQFRPVIDALRTGANTTFASFALPPEWFQQTLGPASDRLQQRGALWCGNGTVSDGGAAELFNPAGRLIL